MANAYHRLVPSFVPVFLVNVGKKINEPVFVISFTEILSVSRRVSISVQL